MLPQFKTKDEPENLTTAETPPARGYTEDCLCEGVQQEQ